MEIVTGMHRSGTSFVTQLLTELGMDTGRPGDFVPTDEWNQDGYYEHADTVVFNDRLILGDTFYCDAIRRKPPEERPLWGEIKMKIAKARYISMRSDNPIRRRARRKQAQLRELYERVKDIVVKDPRFCLTLAEWKRYAKVDKVLFSFRHPLEVAQSLQKREKMPIWFGLKMWRFHVEHFLVSARDTPLVCVDFNRFFEARHTMDELKNCFGFAHKAWSEEEARAILGRVLKKGLKNQTATQPLPADCASLYHELERWRDLTPEPIPYRPELELAAKLDIRYG